MNLTEVLRAPEGKTLEFKRDLSSPDGFLRTVVAFANTVGRHHTHRFGGPVQAYPWRDRACCRSD